jgi:hypothetical protein
MDDEPESGAAANEPAPPPPPPPPPPPSAPGAAGRGGWIGGEPRLDVGSIIGRTFDTYGREWSLFLLLALPAALASLAQAFIVPDYVRGAYQGWATMADADPQRVLRDAAVLIAVGAVGAVLSGIGTLAMIVAADRMWRAQPTGILDALGGAFRAAPRAIALWLLLFVGIVLVAFLAGVVTLILVGLAGAVGVLGLAPLVLVGVVALVFVAVRLTPILVVLVAEGSGVLASVTRTWGLTRGHAIMLFVTGFVVGLCSGLGVYGGSLIASASDSHLVAGLASGLASMIAAPLSAIWPVIAWGDLVGGRHGDSVVIARGRGRMAAVAIVVGLGAMLLIVGIGAVAGSPSSPTLVR